MCNFVDYAKYIYIINPIVDGTCTFSPIGKPTDQCSGYTETTDGCGSFIHKTAN